MTYPWFGDGNRDLWVTDGTPAGTRRVRRFLPWAGREGFAPVEDLVSSGGKVYFPASDGTHGRELWESDGTPEGTRMVVDLTPGGLSAIPDSSSLVIVNGVLFFSADDGKSGPEPWALRLK
jgi:ELWxxDGT repeat protein